ncbi:MAG: HIT family protein [Bacteroidales bacterium]|jgi:histidine triad (HIT) family protein|nr:HIT family protein [Bacteroidales bacterium]
MSTVFTRIVNGEIPSYKVAENDRFYAFLDINPVTKGHTLVIPKEEIDYIFDMESQGLSDLFVFAQTVAKGIKKVIPCKRIGVAVLGLEVPHAHIHLIPLVSEGDMDFKKPKLKLEHEEMVSIASAIAAAIK